MNASTPVHIALLVSTVLALACGSTRNVIPPDSTVAPGDEVNIRAGAAVYFTAFDGNLLDATHLIAPPGVHTIDFEVRRNLRTVTSALKNVFHRSECRVELPTTEGGAYVLRFAGSQDTDVWRGNPNASVGSTMTSFDTQMLVEDQRTGAKLLVPCEFYFDCRRLKEGVSRSSACHDYRSESGIGD